MRNRRNRFKPNVDNINTLYIIKITLKILIVILLLIFIFSSIKMKTSINQQNILAKSNTSNETNENNQTDININSDTNNKNVESNTISERNEITQQKNEPKSTTINMALTGDIMCHNTIYKDAYNSEAENYDFSYIFEDIKYNIQTADIAVR